jgi:hypothetical protein
VLLWLQLWVRLWLSVHPVVMLGSLMGCYSLLSNRCCGYSCSAGVAGPRGNWWGLAGRGGC